MLLRWSRVLRAPSAAQAKKMQQRVEELKRVEDDARSRCAQYPHRIMTRRAPPLSVSDVRAMTFSHSLMQMKKMATDMECLSFCAPKAHWDASVIILHGDPRKEYEVWVNPSVPGYDQRTSVAPMYGMWENCASCGSLHAWVIRPQSIHVTGLDEFGNEKSDMMTGMRARLLMHELDHLFGKTIIQQVVGPEFIVSQLALLQKDLWPPAFPSIEAHMTDQMQFFDYVKNEVVMPEGLEWLLFNAARQQFHSPRIE